MQILKDLYYLFFPAICECCERQLAQNEKLICLKCRFDLPLAEMTEIVNNEVEQTFYGRLKIEFATALLLFKRKGITQKLIHALKYKGQEDLGILFGQWLGSELSDNDRLPKIDYVVPIPLNVKKIKKKGIIKLQNLRKK